MMNKDLGDTKPPRPKIQRASSYRKPRVTSAAKLDISNDKPLFSRSNTLPVPSSQVSTRNSRSSVLNGLPDKDKARSDDGFHSDSDKDSNHSNISVHSSLSHLNRTSSFTKLEPVARLRPMSDTNIPNSANLAAPRPTQVDQQPGEARRDRKIKDLEISIESLMRINAELDSVNKKQAIEIIELKKKLNKNDIYIAEIYDTENEDDEENNALSDVDFLERERDNDIRYHRIRLVIDELIQEGLAALDYTPKINGSRVLAGVQLELTREYGKTTGALPEKVKTTENVDARPTPIIVSEAAEKTCETKIKPPANPSNDFYVNKERIRVIIDELLALAKPGNLHNNAPKTPELKGLGILLKKQGHTSHTPFNHNTVETAPSPSVSLLYELQELLGCGTTESSKNFRDDQRTSLVVPSGIRVFVQAGKEDLTQEDMNNSEAQHSTDRIIRRRSSPNLRTSSKESIDENPVATRHTSWVTSLLTPWKAL